MDAEGEVKDYVKLNHFMKRQNSRIKQEAESKVRTHIMLPSNICLDASKQDMIYLRIIISLYSSKCVVWLVMI